MLCMLGMLARPQGPSAQAGKFRITGRVIDSVSRKTIEYATVTIFKPNTTKPLGGTTSNEKGTFILPDVAAGDYKVVVEFIGYQPVSIPQFSLNDKITSKNLGEIALTRKAQTLQDVTVTAKGGLIENRIDKMVYNAEKDITSQGGVATDVLKKVPQVSVDVDGNVELQGSPNVRFLIDGKPSTIFGSSLNDALQSIPASQIKSIEVITSPGAKYDAEGTGGIINIILKKSNIQGINGNITLSAGSRLENGSMNLNVRRGTFGAHAFVSGDGQVRSTSLSSLNRITQDTAAKSVTRLLQDGSNSFTRNGFQTGIGFDWDAARKDNFGGNIVYNHFGNNSSGITNQQQFINADPSLNLLSAINSIRNSTNHSNFDTYEWNLNYKHKFGDDHELAIFYESNKGNNLSKYSQYQNLLDSNNIFAGTNSNNPGKENETDFQIDYTQPLSEKSSFEIGGKSELKHYVSNSSVNTFNPATSTYLYDARQSFALDYKRQVYAAYASLTFQAFKWLNVKSGGRYERTEINADYSNAHNVNIPSYGTFVPSVYVSHNFNNNQVVKIGYTRRIQRPGYRSLNPFVNAVDPKNLSTGNPNLKPEIGDNVEMSYSRSFEKGGSVNATLFHRNNSMDIQQYITYYPTYLVGDSLYTNVSVSTQENIGTEKNTGLSLYGSMPVTTKLTLRSNMTLFHREIMNRFVTGTTTTSTNYRINLNAAYQFSGTLTGEFFGNFSSARNEVQGRMPSFTTYNLALRKQVLKKKGSIALTATNPFNKYVNQPTALKGPNFTLESMRRIPFRSFGISFNYKFGRLEFKKDKEENNEPNVPQEGS